MEQAIFATEVPSKRGGDLKIMRLGKAEKYQEVIITQKGTKMVT